MDTGGHIVREDVLSPMVRFGNPIAALAATCFYHKGLKTSNELAQYVCSRKKLHNFFNNHLVEEDDDDTDDEDGVGLSG